MHLQCGVGDGGLTAGASTLPATRRQRHTCPPAHARPPARRPCPLPASATLRRCAPRRCCCCSWRQRTRSAASAPRRAPTAAARRAARPARRRRAAGVAARRTGAGGRRRRAAGAGARACGGAGDCAAHVRGRARSVPSGAYHVLFCPCPLTLHPGTPHFPHPHPTPPASSRQSYLDRIERLATADKQRAEAKRAALAAQLHAAQCTFAPAINARSRRMASPTPLDVGQGGRRERRRQAQPVSSVPQPPTAPTRQPLTARCLTRRAPACHPGTPHPHSAGAVRQQAGRRAPRRDQRRGRGGARGGVPVHARPVKGQGQAGGAGGHHSRGAARSGAGGVTRGHAPAPRVPLAACVGARAKQTPSADIPP
jgi:hypothetical protein